MFLFLVGLVVPWLIYLGPLRMSAYRLVLCITILPCLGMWVAGKAGRMRAADVAVVLLPAWCALGLVRIHGMHLAVETSGIIFLESVGPYLLARCYVRDADDFHKVVQVLFGMVALLTPFAIVEFATGHNVSRELFAMILPTRTEAMPPRFGLTRVQSVFDHPILFGLFAGSLLSLVYLVLGHQRDVLQRSLKSAVVAGASLMSLSSGPLIGLGIQAFFLSWNGMFSANKSRWKVLAALLLSMYVVIELAANRSVLQIVGGHLLDAGSYWYRTWIFDYGIRSVASHPLYGVGMGEWERPAWMGDSIDNFWLYEAVRHGVPAVLLLLLACVSIVSSLGFKKGLDAKVTEYRTAFLMTLMAFCLVGGTVHFWGAAYVLFLFLMGSGVWMLDVTEAGEQRSKQAQTASRHVRRASVP